MYINLLGETFQAEKNKNKTKNKSLILFMFIVFKERNVPVEYSIFHLLTNPYCSMKASVTFCYRYQKIFFLMLKATSNDMEISLRN